jgi:hypothetical protein
MPAAQHTSGRLRMQQLGLNIYSWQPHKENARICREQSADLGRPGPGGHLCNVSAEAPCAEFHKSSPRKRAHAADRDGPWVRREISRQPG